MAQETIRESVIAGSWYPGHPDILRKDIHRYLEKASPVSVPGELRALIVPHAGYMYSGGVAAHAYRLLQDQSFDRVVIVAPSHRAYFKGASVYTLGGYRTPFGVVPLDREIVDALLEHSSLIQFVPEADAEEHSLEIQLPFLQVVLGDFRLTPIIVADQSYTFCEQLAQALCDICRDMNVLLIASTDLSHFHSYGEARRLDQVVCDRVVSFDPQALSLDLQGGKCEACGAGPMMAVMLAARGLGADGAKLLQYANSGDVAGDRSRVVGYLAAALYRSPSSHEHIRPKPGSNVGVDLGLNDDEKRTLCEIARQAIRSRCRAEPMPEVSSDSARLMEKSGAFVCLHKGDELRGCIGMIEAKAPLLETVKEMAVQAAFSDPRFCSVQEEELRDLDIEISVLTPLQPIKDPDEIEIGRHGLYIRKGYHSGLLLPQVASERGWGREEFLRWTCRKAGLPDQAWKDPDTELFLFSADVF
jgi:hypothetical protein